jgi:hypothetical protein
VTIDLAFRELGVPADGDQSPWQVCTGQARTPVSRVVAEVAEIVTMHEGRPACRVHPDIHKDLYASIAGGAQAGGRTLRALVLALDNVDPIPDAPFLYECDLRIAADARPGRYPLVLSNVGASDPFGSAPPVAADHGTLEVLSGANVSLNENGTGAGGGCAIEPPAVPDGWLALLLGALILRRMRGGRQASTSRATARDGSAAPLRAP